MLITGGAGFLGINLIRFLLARGHAITSLDLAEFEYPDVRGQIRVVRGDIRDPAAVRQAMEGAIRPVASLHAGDSWSMKLSGSFPTHVGHQQPALGFDNRRLSCVHTIHTWPRSVPTS